MAILPAIGAGLSIVGAIGAFGQKTPRYDMSGMNEALRLIEKQYGDIETYFKEASGAFETQYQGFYGQTMQDAVSNMASRGIFESPASERGLSRTRRGLAETYATGKSQLAGQRLSAIGSVDQQKAGYLQNLANLQYSREMAKQQNRASKWGALGGLGGGLMGL